MNRTEILNEVTTALLNDQLDTQGVSKAIDSYKSIFSSFSTFESDIEASKKDIQMNNGIAIGTTWAASCIDDHIRTKCFVKGTFEAIQDQLKSKKSVHLLYAGTGPHGTLILPLLTAFSPEQLKVTLLEINETSMKSVKQIVQELKLEDSVMEYLMVDATTHVFEPIIPYDIVLSETMQHALVKEQQIPLFLNVMKQVSPSTQMIPENIQLDLAFINTSTEALGNNSSISIQTLINFNRTCIDAYNSDASASEKSFIDVSIVLPEFDKEIFDYVAVTTEIHVYGNERIKQYESGLTVPKILQSTAEFIGEKTKIHLQFKISSASDYSLSFEN